MGVNRWTKTFALGGNNSLSQERGSEQSEQASKWVGAAERACKSSRAEQANEWAVQANERMDEQVAQYCSLYSWLFWTMVQLPLSLPEIKKKSRNKDKNGNKCESAEQNFAVDLV